MKKNYPKLFLISLILLLLCSTSVLADWNPGDPAKWFQLPDLTPNGIDICMDSKGGQRAVGDDFLCTETGPITDVHLWVSMRNDVNFPITGVTLSIYSNNPSGPGGFSQPDYLLWSRNFLAGSFTKRLYYTAPTGMGEWFWDLRSAQFLANADRNIWQLNFRINPSEAFHQAGSPDNPIIYWLVVEAQIPQDSQYWLGWKTRQFPDHFMDDAVWRSMPTTSWLKLSYQSPHPYYPMSIDMAFAITTQHTEPNTMDFGDAPEGGIAYPATGVIGSFPTCKTVGAAGWIQHTNFGAYFGPSVDFEGDGNGGLCPGCFPPYDQDECFADGDAGLIVPQSYTIDALNNVVTCPQCTGSSLGNTCQMAYWGTNIDIDVHNHMPSQATGYVNLLIDWNQDGQWSGSSACPLALTPEHVLVNFPVPNPYDGPLSGLMPAGTGFLIGPNPGYVWARFSITEQPVTTNWNGEGSFEDGETEDYLLLVNAATVSLDFGDANDPPYPTLLANNGARHVIVQGILMGALIDSELNGQPNATATGDDNSNLDDEDGVTFTSSLIPGQLAYVDVDLTNCAAGVGLFLNAWVDFDGNGSWAELSDQIFSNWVMTSGAVNSLSFWVPATAQIGTTSARFRLSTIQGLSYTGLAPDGEVEDYTVDITEKFVPKHLKWSQPPLEMDPSYTEPTFCGWNEVSWIRDPAGEYISGAADDFRCIGSMPVTSIHWWGSYYNWSSHAIPQVRPVAWMVKFWANVPQGPTGDPPYSHPGELLWQIIVPNERVKTEYLGWDYFPESPVETCFEYYLDLNPSEYFKQHKFLSDTNDSIYWLGITAIYPTDTTIEYPWGWKTRPAHWMDDAVHYECFPGPLGQICEYWPLEDSTTGESYDLAFELDTDPNYIKWEQPYTGIRDWPHYNDEISMAEAHGPSLDIIRQCADDWLCQKRMPVMAIVWWGSYLGYTYQPCTTTTFIPPVKPDYFLMSILTDVPVGDPCNQYPFSHPGQVLWEYKAYNYDEVLVGYDKQPEGQVGPPREAVFRYSVRLPEDKWFKQKKVDQIFWLSVMAVYETNYPDYIWGWTNHKHFYNDDAVGGYWDNSGAEPVWRWEEIYDQTPASADLSFMLFTDPNQCYSCADYDSSGLINFKDFAQFALEWTWSGLPGGYNKADLDCDGDVDCADLKIFCDQWLKSCL